MTMLRRLGLALAVVSMVATGVYFFVYLTRWEWNRALISGMLLLIVQVLVLGAVVLGRLGRLERQMSLAPAPAHARRRAAGGHGPVAGSSLEHLRRTRPESTRAFAWLDPTRSQGTNVFVPVLMGAGVVVSALAWLVERIARVVARPGMEVGLARSLDSIAYPDAILAADDHVPSAVDLLDGPAWAWRR